MATLVPKILITATLPASVSYSDTTEPKLEIKYELQGVPCPIIIALPYTPLWPTVNAIRVLNTNTGEEQRLPTADINRKTGPSLESSEQGSFIVLKPGETYVQSESFRPFGHTVYDKERIAAMGAAKYQLLRLGMHLLELGEEYSIEVRSGLSIHQWMEGSYEDLKARNAVWKPQGVPIEVVPGEAVKFKVER